MTNDGAAPTGPDGGDPDGDHRALARLVVEGADVLAAFGRRMEAADIVDADQRALLGWVALRLQQILAELP